MSGDFLLLNSNSGSCSMLHSGFLNSQNWAQNWYFLQYKVRQTKGLGKPLGYTCFEKWFYVKAELINMLFS